MHVPFGAYRRLLFGYLGPQWVRVLGLGVLLLSGIGLQLLNPQVIRYFLDTAQAGGATAALLFAALVFIAVAVLQQLCSLATVYMGEHVGWTATNRLRADLARHCLRLDLSFHKTHTPGALIERVDGDVTALANFFSQFVVSVLGNGLLIGGVLLLLFREDWRVGLGLTAYALLAFVALGAVQNLAVTRWATEREARTEQFSFLEERINGMEEIRANGAEAYTLRRLYLLMRQMLRSNRSARLFSNIAFLLTNCLAIIGYAVGLALGAYLYSQGQVSIGTAFLIVYYVGMLATPLENIRAQLADLQQATVSVGRVSDLFHRTPQVREQVQATLPTGPLAVSFANVSFAYADALETVAGAPEQASDRPASLVLNNISFTLEPGRVLGLLGHTGSGKTTLTRLLFRLYDPTAGAVQLGGVDLRSIALADLRARVGVVTQDVQLFHASIRDNLTFFDRRIGTAQIERALRELDLWEWVQALPAGLDTQLASGGQGLSAGEAQLLAFARVYLKDPGLVILDEASARLDPATERLLERAIDRLLHGRSGIIIAHRLQTVQRVDEIMILEQGRVREHGPRAVLARNPESRFAQLLQTGLEEVLQ